MQKKNKLFLGLAIFCGIGVFVSLAEMNIAMFLFYIALTFLFFYLWRTKKKIIDTPSNSTSKSIEVEPEPTPIYHETVASSSPISVPTSTASDRITKNYRVAGVSYRQAEIESLGSENPDFSLSKKEMCEQYLDGDRIYKYDFFITNVNLEPEPTNEVDSNAVKVIADNVHIGYIKAGKCSEVKNILNSANSISIDIEIKGGPYKELFIDEDENCTIEKETDDYRATVSISYKR